MYLLVEAWWLGMLLFVLRQVTVVEKKFCRSVERGGQDFSRENVSREMRSTTPQLQASDIPASDVPTTSNSKEETQ